MVFKVALPEEQERRALNATHDLARSNYHLGNAITALAAVMLLGMVVVAGVVVLRKVANNGD